MTAVWVAWILAFGVIEGLALVSDQPGDTLSEHIWGWFAVKGKPRAWQARRAALVMLMAWLTAHFLTGGEV